MSPPHRPFPSLLSLLPSFPSLRCSSTFKDAERASLRDSGHGDSDQADSDQDTNKGSHCDTSAREALKMKAPAVNGQPFEQGEWMCGRRHLQDAFADSLPHSPRASVACLFVLVWPRVKGGHLSPGGSRGFNRVAGEFELLLPQLLLRVDLPERRYQKRCERL